MYVVATRKICGEDEGLWIRGSLDGCNDWMRPRGMNIAWTAKP